MAVGLYRFRVDWDGDGTFGHAQADITQKVWQLRSRYGKDKASTLNGRAVAGTLSATLYNPSGLFSGFNTSSPISGLIKPRRKVQLQMKVAAPDAWTDLWTGWLITIVPENPIKELPRAKLSAHGSLALLNADDARVSPKTSILTGTAYGQVLDAASWPAGDRDVDAGQTTMVRWWANSKSLFAQRKIDDTEIGFTHEDRSGNVVWEDRHRRLKAPHLTSQQTYTDEAATIRYQDVSQEDPFQNVFKVFRASVTEYLVGATVALWTVTGTPSIGAGQSVDFWAEYPQQDSPVEAVGVDSWVTPVSSTDYVANSQAGGGGTDLTASIAIVVSKFPMSMKLSITNNAAVTAFLTTLQARGAPMNQSDAASVTREVTGSPVESEWPSPAEFIPDLDEGKDHVDYLAAVHGIVSPTLTIGYIANAAQAFLEDARDREVSDRVTVKSNAATDLGINEDFFIDAIIYELDRRRRHLVRLELSPTRNTVPFWVLGTSKLGKETALNL